MSAVADAGSVVAVFGDAGATVLSSGAVVATDRVGDRLGRRGGDPRRRRLAALDRRRRRRGAAPLPARGELVRGRVRRATASTARVLGAAMLDGRASASCSTTRSPSPTARVTRYGAPALATLSAAAGWGAGVAPDAVTVFDAAHDRAHLPARRRDQRRGRARRAALRDDAARALRLHRAAAISRSSTTPARTRSTAWSRRATQSGSPTGRSSGWSTASASRRRAARTCAGRHARALRPAVTCGSSARGRSCVSPAQVPESAQSLAWSTTLAPIFARSCSSCHQPGGVSGTESVDRRGMAVGAQRDSGPRRREQDDAARGPRAAGGRPRRYRRLGATSPANRAMRGETNRKVTLPRRRTARRPFPRLLPVRLLPVRPLRGLPPPRRRFRRRSARSARTASRR